MKLSGTLGGALVRMIVGVTAAALFFFVIAAYLIFGLLDVYHPNLVQPGGLLPDGLELLITCTLGVIALLVAGLLAFRLARRFLVPLNDLARQVRTIAAGDLSARVPVGEHLNGEAAALLGRFNTMASGLEKHSAEIATWNAIIAHELRTPVTILRGRLQGLVDGVFVADAELFESLLRQAEQLAHLIEDLRTVTLVETNRLGCNKAGFDLSEELELLIGLIRPSYAQAGFSIALDVKEPFCFGDAVRVRQALAALLDNARKHGRPGEVRVATASTLAGVEITVSNDGESVPDQLLTNIFKPFVHAGTTRENTGLGLYVVRSIAEAHEGNLHYSYIANRPTFRLLLPHAPSAAQT